MRPLKLTLTAFGPYHATEEIDFTALAPHDLFVISGNTGAGKTSIFDGISYALYGGASGEDRKEALGLRSDFADDSLPTSAELLFSLRGKTYRVYRQLPYLKAGNKSQTPGKAELYEVDLDSDDLFAETAAVDRQITTEVDQKILTLIGLNKAQFNQLVMLPQGEYQRFLTSSTHEKELILRTVFNTEKYQSLITNFKETRDTHAKKVTELSATQKSQLQLIFNQLPQRESPLFSHSTETGENHLNPTQAIEGLEIEQSHYLDAQKALTDTVKTAQQSVQSLQKQIAEANATNLAFQTLKATEAALQTHLTQLPEIEQTQSRIDLAERAMPIEKSFDTVIRLREEAVKINAELKATKQQTGEAEEALKQANTQFEAENAKEPMREALTREVISLEANAPRIASLAQLKADVGALNQQKADLTAQHQKCLEAQKDQQQTMRTLTTELTALETASFPAFALAKFLPMLKRYHKLIAKIAEESAKLTTAQSRATAAKGARLTAKTHFDTMYQAWISEQAVHLQKSLRPHESCPVCGSLEHPALDAFAAHPASAITREAITPEAITSTDSAEAAFTEAQAKYLKAETDAQEAMLHVKHLLQTVESLQEEAKTEHQLLHNFSKSSDGEILSTYLQPALSLPEVPNSAEASIIDDAQLHDILTALESRITLVARQEATASQALQAQKSARATQNALNEALTQSQQSIDAILTSLQPIDAFIIEKQSEISQITQVIPTELQDPAQFTAMLDQKKTQLQQLKAALINAQKAQEGASQKSAVLAHQYQQEVKQYEALIAQGKTAKHALDTALINAGFIVNSEIENEIESDINTGISKNGERENNPQKMPDEAAFLQAKLDSDTLKALRDQVNLYHQQHALLSTQIAHSQEALKEKTPIDITTLETALIEAETALKNAQAETIKIEHYLTQIQASITAIRKNRETLDKAMHHLQKLVEVHDLLRGENPLKLSFERYILIEYFERVIEAANLRLQKMTNGQFEFTRSESLASRGKQSGLDLDIYDAYTGDARDVKTLSGGEKFKASLSLSLGMADVIQAHQGGISIDTLFIDEGFGSLDEESLLQAIDVLIELQASGRMIGVISHVEELKQTLPARIEVVKTKGGYSQTQILVS